MYWQLCPPFYFHPIGRGPLRITSFGNRGVLFETECFGDSGESVPTLKCIRCVYFKTLWVDRPLLRTIVVVFEIETIIFWIFDRYLRKKRKKNREGSFLIFEGGERNGKYFISTYKISLESIRVKRNFIF